ncbi:MAG: glycerol-3-phosphate acyltransferase [Candidatus Marinimicrobia bacterium]|nr:glycerol-3-phosphate acyltransferase [Candidatus Neomarinimicrobiota bacterium]
MNIYIIYLICLLSGYLTGSILFAYVITKLVKGEDIRELGNNNPGAYNTFNSTGKFWGILTGFLDSFKALIPILIANHFFNLSTISLWLIGVGAIIGHGYPLFFNFKGGRAAGTLMGIYLFFIPYELLASFIIMIFLVIVLIKSHRGVWAPLGIITFSAIACLFFNHTTDVKIIIWLSGLIGLYFNRDSFPKISELILQKNKYKN